MKQEYIYMLKLDQQKFIRYHNTNNTYCSIKKLQHKIKDFFSTVSYQNNEVPNDVLVNQYISVGNITTGGTIIGGIDEQAQQHNLRCGA